MRLNSAFFAFPHSGGTPQNKEQGGAARNVERGLVGGRK
jgi:hypothetical protein